MHFLVTRYLAAAIAAGLLPYTAVAQSGHSTSSLAAARFLDARPAPVVVLNPGRTRLLILEPAASSSARFATYTALIARPIGRGETRRIVIPWNARVAHPLWSPNGESIAFTVVEESGISLWVAEARSGESRMLAGPVLSGALGNPCQWLPEGGGLLCSKVVTQQPLSSQLAVVSLTGAERLVGGPGLYSDVQLSPDGRFLLVEARDRSDASPVPNDGFRTRTELWDISGSVVKALGTGGPSADRRRSADEVPSGPRAFEWRNDAAATLVWVEALDAGTPTVAAPVRDRMLQLDAPFSGTPATLLDVQGRIQEAVWGRSDLAMVTESWSGTGRTRTWLIDPSRVGGAPALVSERASADRYADPGRFIMTHNGRGRAVLQTSSDGRFVFLAGVSASPLGDRPFLDRMALASRKLLRLWRSEGSYFEETIALLNQDADLLITRRGSVNVPPNYFIRDLRKPGAGRLSALTEFR
jgi:dipeptidyl aminopeptidase/acylaminoacyl peptidase